MQISTDRPGRWGRPRGLRRIFLLAAVVFTLVFFALGALVVWRTAMQLRAQDWPIAEGLVVRADVKVSRGSGPGHRTSYDTDLLIRYRVDGRGYETTRWRFAALPQLLPNIRKGHTVEVHYDPNDPAGGVLVTGIQDEDRQAIIFVLPLVTFPAGMWLAGLGARLSSRSVAFGRPRVRYVGHIERLAISEMGIAAALVGLLLGQMAAMFLGFLWTGFGPGEFVWLLAAGPIGILIVAAIALMAKRKGAGQMILDCDAGTIRFKGSMGMATRVVTADVKELASVGVLTRQTPLWPVHSILVRARTADQELPREYRVGHWGNRQKCESIVDWLIDRLRLPREDKTQAGDGPPMDLDKVSSPKG